VLFRSQAPQFLSPIIVGKFVDKNEYGAFFVAWTIVTVVFLIPHTVGQTVLSEGSRAHADVERQAKLGLFVAGGFMIAMTIGAYTLGGERVPVVIEALVHDPEAELLLLGDLDDRSADVSEPSTVAHDRDRLQSVGEREPDARHTRRELGAEAERARAEEEQRVEAARQLHEARREAAAARARHGQGGSLPYRRLRSARPRGRHRRRGRGPSRDRDG